MISIIIPTLNEEKYIGTLLGFLTNHPQNDKYEVIVVDGGSDDATLEIIKSFSSVQLHQTSEASRAHQMNQGAHVSKGDILYFVHADVQLIPSFVDDIFELVAKGVDSGCYRYRFCKPHHPLLYINGLFTRFPFRWCRGGDQTLFITRKAFNKLEGFDESHVIMEDYDLLDRIEKEGVSFKVIPKNIKVSARKYLNNSYLKVQLTNLKAMRMYRRGVATSEIKVYYHATLN